MQRQAIQRTETRNAILWEILSTTERKCRVKIQGSNEYIVAFYSQNWNRKPEWLKIGSAVRLLHVSGLRGRLEIVYDGGTVPTAIEGADSLPSMGQPGDSRIYGLDVRAGRVPFMGVKVSPGTYRINNVIYTFPPSGTAIMMNDPDFIMGAGGTMGTGVSSVADIVMLSAPSYPNFRYDVLCLGADGVIDVISGAAASSDPVMPSGDDLPGSHVRLCHVLLYWGMTEVKSKDIDCYWSSPYPTTVDIIQGEKNVTYLTSEDPPHDCIGLETGDFQLTIKDQYNHNMTTEMVVQGLCDGVGELTFGVSPTPGNNRLKRYTTTAGTLVFGWYWYPRVDPFCPLEECKKTGHMPPWKTRKDTIIITIYMPDLDLNYVYFY